MPWASQVAVSRRAGLPLETACSTEQQACEMIAEIRIGSKTCSAASVSDCLSKQQMQSKAKATCMNLSSDSISVEISTVLSLLLPQSNGFCRKAGLPLAVKATTARKSVAQRETET